MSENVEHMGLYYIAICDDDPGQLSHNEQVIRRACKNQELVISLYTDGNELIKDIEAGKTIDVLFCDMEMPAIDGLSIGIKIREKNEKIFLIYLTAYDKYAVKAYETRAFRYLIKPLKQEDADRVMQTVFAEKSREKKIVIRDMEGIVALYPEDILYFEAHLKSSFIYSEEGEYSDRVSLDEYEKQLEEFGFYRIHRKYLVNCRKIKQLTQGDVVLENGEKLPVSRRNRSGLYQYFIALAERGTKE